MMPTERLSVVVTRRLPEAVETRLSELFNVGVLRSDDTPMSRAELTEALQNADVLVPTITDTIDSALIAQAGDRLKLIANYGAGIDHIDVATARQRGILVSNTPGVLTDRYRRYGNGADSAAVTRRIPEGLALMQSGEWDRLGTNGPFGRSRGRQAAWYFGNGTIGRPSQDGRAPLACKSITTIANACAPESRRRAGSHLLGQSGSDGGRAPDAISINCPHTPSTFHLMNARRLKLLKPSAVIVNTSRGEVIDENALTACCVLVKLRVPVLTFTNTKNRNQSAFAGTEERGSIAAYGFGHTRRTRGNGKGFDQYQDL